MDSEVPAVQDMSSNANDGICESKQKGLAEPKPEAISYTSQEYADMKDDPSMRYVYSSQRPAAGYPSPHIPHNEETTHTGRRHYKTATDTIETKPEPASLNMSPSHHSKPEGISYSNQEYTKMKGDPSMRYEYSSGRAAAGNTSSKIPHSSERSPTSRRHYKAASEITESKPDSVDQNMSPSRHLKPKGSSYSNQEYVDMKDDPSMRYVYSSQRPAAGYPSPQVPYDTEPHPTGRRHYEMASDTVDTNMDKSRAGSTE